MRRLHEARGPIRQFSVLVRREPGLDGQWVAHCLSWDLVSQGDTPSDAMKMLSEAIGMVIEDDQAEGSDPSERPAAPEEFWDIFQRVQHAGTRMSAADVDTFALSVDRPVVFAVIIYWQDFADALPKSVPPPFMIAQVENGDQLVRSSSGRATVATMPWHALRYEHTQVLRERLAADYAPATANRFLAALKGCWRLGIMDGETYRQAADLEPVPGSRR